MQDVDLLKDALGLVQSGTPALGEGAQAVPLIADALAPGVHRHAVMVLQGAVDWNDHELVGDLCGEWAAEMSAA